MVDAPERIWATFEQHESGKGHPHTYATAAKTKGHEYVRADRHAELEAEVERQALAIDAYKAMLAQAEQDIALSRTGAVKVAGAKLAKAVFGVDLVAHPRDTNPVASHETANVRDKPEGQQEPVITVYEPYPGAFDDILGPDTRPSEQAVTEAARDVLAERHRQVAVEGWTPEHDRRHASGELAIAAACYALNATDDSDGPEIRFVGAELWPWADEWWKPTDPRRDLVKAGALILAEIERIDRRAALKAATEAGR